jgi:hypothetical protein
MQKTFVRQIVNDPPKFRPRKSQIIDLKELLANIKTGTEIAFYLPRSFLPGRGRYGQSVT